MTGTKGRLRYNMKNKIICTILMTSAIISLTTACSSGGSKSYADGTYEGQSSVYEAEEAEEGEEAAGNGYGVVSITIQDNVITACDFKTYTGDGELKDEEYGKEGGEIKNSDYYNKAQKAVAACDEYAAQLVENGSLDGIDAISGATVNYKEFVEAVNNALGEAEE